MSERMSDERLAELSTARGWDGEEADALGMVAQRWVPLKYHAQYLDPIGLLVNELLDALRAERAALDRIEARLALAEAVCEAAKRHDVGYYAGSHALLRAALDRWREAGT